MKARGTRIVAIALLLAGCSEGMNGTGDGGDAGAIDAGAVDAASGDAGVEDAGASDGGMDATISIDAGDDAGASDGGASDAGDLDASATDGGADAMTPGDGGAGPTCPAFVSPPADWALPKGASGPFPDTETITCPSGSPSPRYALLDLDGDGLRDLVITGTCGTGGDPGLTHWLFARNTGAGFAAAVMWPLPSGYTGGFPDTETLSCAVASARRFGTFDIDGDRRPDLVITSECSGAGMIGRAHWLVHLNTGAGFAATATTFALPAYSGSFADVAGTSCVGSEPRHALLDVDGDLDPDLVVTSLCDGSSMVGRTRWWVHLNDGTRFAASATDYALPGGFSGLSFSTTSNETCPLSGSPWFTTTDLDGDRIPDLVVTSLCSGGPIGVSRWDVYRGSATGFASTATAWTLPSYSGASFATPEGPRTCTLGTQPIYRLLDADGDAAPDLIVTGRCSGAAPLGRTEWAVHLGTGAGFDNAPLLWALPRDYGAANLTDTDTVTCVMGTSPRYDTVDLDGDGVMDFVATALCSGAGMLSRTHWALHPGCLP